MNSVDNNKLIICREINNKTKNKFSGEQFIRINYHDGGITTMEILSKHELLKKIS